MSPSVCARTLLLKQNPVIYALSAAGEALIAVQRPRICRPMPVAQRCSSLSQSDAQHSKEIFCECLSRKQDQHRGCQTSKQEEKQPGCVPDDVVMTKICMQEMEAEAIQLHGMHASVDPQHRDSAVKYELKYMDSPEVEKLLGKLVNYAAFYCRSAKA